MTAKFVMNQVSMVIVLYKTWGFTSQTVIWTGEGSRDYLKIQREGRRFTKGREEKREIV